VQGVNAHRQQWQGQEHEPEGDPEGAFQYGRHKSSMLEPIKNLWCKATVDRHEA
jgi:hypothetical protein